MKEITRRQFLKNISLVPALLGVDFTWKNKTAAKPAEKNKVDKWVYSTCGYCSVGCGIEIGLKNGKAVAARGNKLHPTNNGRLCIKGYTEYMLFHTPGRAAAPLIKKDNEFYPIPWNEALEIMCGKIKDTLKKYGPKSIAVYSTGQLQNEEFYALGKLARAGFKTPHYDGNTTLCMSSAVAGYKRSLGEDTPPGCYQDIEEADCIMLIGSNISEMHPILYDRIIDGKLKKKTTIITVDPLQTIIASRSDIYLDINPGTDLVLLNAMAAILFKENLVDENKVKSHTTGLEDLKAYLLKEYNPNYVEKIVGIPHEKIKQAALTYRNAKRSLILWTMGINQSVQGTKAVDAICNLALLTGHIGKKGASPFSLTGQCNAMGSRILSSTSTYPAFRKLKKLKDREEIARLWGCSAKDLPDERTPAKEIFEKIRAGEIKILWIIATNPTVSFPDTKQTNEALKKLDFLIVQDAYHPTETSVFADLILPAAMWGEKTGTMVNSERRVNLAKKASLPPGQAKSDFEIFLMVAEKMGYNNLFKGWTKQEDAFEEIRLTTKGKICDLYGMNYTRLEKENGLQWPCPSPDHPGTERLLKDLKFFTPTEKANLHVLKYKQLTEVSNKKYPFILNTGRNQYHWHTGTKTRKIELLNELEPESYVKINPKDAELLGIKDKDLVKVESVRGEIHVKAVISPETRPGAVFIPFHYGENTPNFLIPDIVDEFSYQPNYKQSAVNLVPDTSKILKV